MDANQDVTQMLLESWLPFIVLIGVYLYFMRQMKNGKNGLNPQIEELKEINKTLKEISQKLDK